MMCLKSVATCNWFQKFYFIFIYVNVIVKTILTCPKYGIDVNPNIVGVHEFLVSNSIDIIMFKVN